MSVVEPNVSDVNVSDPSPDSQNDQVVHADATEPSAVTDVEGSGPNADERPWKNYKAEMDRKYQELRGTLGDLVNVMLTLRSQGQVVPAATDGGGGSPREVADDELAKRAAMGDPDAHREYTERIVRRQTEAQAGVTRRQQIVSTSLSTLYRRYPALNDATHPLTKAAMRAKSILLATGDYAPNDPAVDLEAIKLAVVDNPALAASASAAPAVANEPGEPRRTPGASDVDGSTPRRTTTEPKVPPLTDKERAIARRMGIKDPAGAKARFLKRVDEGKSGVSPQVLQIMREQG